MISHMFVRLVATGSLLFSCAAACGRGTAVEAPPIGDDVKPPRASGDSWSVVLLTIDALRADHLGCYGYPRATSPRIDELAKQGLVFEQAAVQWPKTAPSMASLLSSTYGSTSGVMRTTLDKKVPRHYELLPELLHAAGYQTLGVVSNLSLAPRFHFDQGFERFLVENKNTYANHVSELARGLLEERDRDRPYFLWVHYLDPHAPYTPPSRYAGSFVGDALYQSDQRPPVPVDPRVRDPHLRPKPGCEVGQIPAYAYLPGKECVRDYVAQYDGDVRFLDEHVGAFLEWMRVHGHLDRAILVFTADHGESLGDHNYYFEHGRFPYDDCVRVPLILLHPEWKPGRIGAPVGLIDLAPTLLEMIGLEPGWQFEGRSLLSWLKSGASEQDARSVFSESGYLEEFEISVRRGRYKLIRIGSRHLSGLLTGEPYELYDVIADPSETKNLVDELPEICAALREELDAYVEVARMRRPPPQEGEAFTPDEDERRVMEELGYAAEKERAEGDEYEHDKQDDGGR
jgi:arylsulfatase A-like enzyme